MNPTILVVDDDAAFRAVTSALLEDEGYGVTCAADGNEAIALLGERHFDLVLSDLVMTEVSGLQVLETAKTLSPRTIVIMVTGFASVESAVEAIKRGAEDYLTKPCGNAELLLKVERALAQRQKDEELVRLRDVVAQSHSFGNLIGKSPRMQQVFRLAQQVAGTDATVLLLGETGTGKELLARAIHFNSPRCHGPFVAVNCAAIAETLLESELFGHERGAFTGAIRQKPGRFEMAEKGTLFLDEVGDIPMATQIKLLRVLQEREFERVGGNETIHCDIRLISATNQNLEQAIQEKKFREDLYYRLNVVPIRLPALRERPEDIPLLARHFLQKYVQALNKPVAKISEAALNLLLQHKWPATDRAPAHPALRAHDSRRGRRQQKRGLPHSRHQFPHAAEPAGGFGHGRIVTQMARLENGLQRSPNAWVLATKRLRPQGNCNEKACNIISVALLGKLS
jgi:DNA-binding NtrC family response regulator